MSEEKVRLALKWSAETGSDPYLVLYQMGLLWDRSRVISARRDTLRAAADYLENLVDSQIPAQAKGSAGAMKQWITEKLRELERAQNDQNQGQIQEQQ